MKWTVPLILLVTLTACSSKAPAPVGYIDGRTSSSSNALPAPNNYTVKRGDTLYSISWRYGMDYRDVARINGIREPYTIYVGQRLRFSGAAAASAPNRPVTTASKPQTATTSRPATSASGSASASKPSVTPTPDPYIGNQNLTWHWPTNGNVATTYAANNAGRKGIDIVGQAGQPIVAAAAGKVVYSGSGLPRYGNLLIIKHNEVYLSAYAHSQTLLVKEGELVKAGQRIALMGRTGTQRDQLYFEIRRNGKPVDPMRFLPKR